MKAAARNRRLPSILTRGIGLVIMAAILSRVDYGKMGALFSDIRPPYLAAALALLLPMLLIKAFRWNMILRDRGIGYSLGRAFVLFWIGIFFGTLTPGKAGDLVIVRGDPTENIRDTRNVQLVVKAGEIYDPEALLQSAEGKIGPSGPERVPLPWTIRTDANPRSMHSRRKYCNSVRASARRMPCRSISASSANSPRLRR